MSGANHIGKVLNENGNPTNTHIGAILDENGNPQGDPSQEAVMQNPVESARQQNFANAGLIPNDFGSPTKPINPFFHNFAAGITKPRGMVAGVGAALPVIGTMIGAPAGFLGAGGGAAAGEILNQDLRQIAGIEDTPVSEKLKRMAITGAATGAADIALTGLGKLANPERLYASALKPLTSLKPNVRDAVIQAGLRNGFKPNEAGYFKSLNAIKSVTDEINNTVSQATQAGQRFDLPSIIKPKLDELRALKNTATDPVGYEKAIDNFETKFLDRPNPITPEDLLSIKRSLGQDLAPYFAATKKMGYVPRGDVLPNKIDASAYFKLRDQLETSYPQLKSLNEDDSALLNLHAAIARASGRISNRELIGLPEMAMGTMEAAGAQSPVRGFLTMLAYKTLNNPTFKSVLAIALKRAEDVTKPLGQMIPPFITSAVSTAQQNGK